MSILKAECTKPKEANPTAPARCKALGQPFQADAVYLVCAKPGGLGQPGKADVHALRCRTNPHFTHGKRREGPSAAGDSGSYSRSACPQADTSSGRHFDLNAPSPTTLTFAQQSSDRQRKSHRCEKCGLTNPQIPCITRYRFMRSRMVGQPTISWPTIPGLKN